MRREGLSVMQKHWLARNHRLSVYDAAYLELALREGIPLATLDAGLRRAAAAEGVTLVSRGSADGTSDS